MGELADCIIRSLGGETSTVLLIIPVQKSRNARKRSLTHGWVTHSVRTWLSITAL